MKKYFLTFAIIITLCAAPLTAQNVHEVQVQTTKNLVINSELPVYIYKSDTLKVKVITGQQKLKGITITPGTDGLSIESRYTEIDNANMGSVIEIYTNDLQNISISGNSNVYLKNTFSATEMNISVSGNSDLAGDITPDHLNITVTGASNVNVTGSATSVNAVVSGSSDLKMLDLVAQKLNTTITGASDAYVNATQELNAVASGASDIFYKNEPAKLIANATGSSDIRKYNGESLDGIHVNSNNNKNNYNPQNSKHFAATPKDMFGGGKMHQDLVWMGIDLGIDGLVDLSNGFDLQPQGSYNFMEMNYGRNAHVRVNFFEWRFNLVKNVFNIVTGMGMDFQHFAFAQKIKFDEADDYPGQTFTTPVVGMPDSIHSINRSRLAVQYFNIPLFFNLRTKKTEKHRNQFNFTFGVVGGIKTGSSSRIQYTENSYDAKEEKFDDFNLSTFTATAMVRIKYSFFSIYASYQFTPMFRGQNPNLYPFSIGVTLLSW